jgi:hypothetical protein
MLRFGAQRISNTMLRKIENRLAGMFEKLAVGANVLTMHFGKADFGAEANYFELPKDWLALCYASKLDKKTLPLRTPPGEDNHSPEIEDIESVYGGLLGFSGIVTTREGNVLLPAVFLNSERGSATEACHTLIHEMVHMHSYKSQGFQNAEFKQEWSSKGILAAFLPQSMPKKDRLENVKAGYYTVVDEGVTELFARIVTHSLKLEAIPPEIPRLHNIPVYEFPLSIACDLARAFGLSTLAGAYFDGDLEFHKRLAEKNRKDMVDQDDAKSIHTGTGRYSDRYFSEVSKLEITSSRYVLGDEPPIDKKDRQAWALHRGAAAVVNNNVNRLGVLGKLGVETPEPAKLARTKADTYNDPAVAVWNEQLGDVMSLAGDGKSTVHPAILAIGGVALTYAAYKTITESS